MTYKELKNQLNGLTDEQLNMDVTIYNAEEDEFYGCYSPKLEIITSDFTLDEGHPYLTIKKPDE
jgi:hypothetical protein